MVIASPGAESFGIDMNPIRLVKPETPAPCRPELPPASAKTRYFFRAGIDVQIESAKPQMPARRGAAFAAVVRRAAKARGDTRVAKQAFALQLVE